MIARKRLGTVVLALVLVARGAAAQATSDPMQDMLARMDSMHTTMQAMHHMMMSMHGGTDTHQGMQGMAGMQGAPGAATCSMAELGPLFRACPSILTLTPAQAAELTEILARARRGTGGAHARAA